MSGTFMDKSFSVHLAGDKSYRDNWEATFGKRTSDTPTPSEARHPGTKPSDVTATGALRSSGKENGPGTGSPEPPCDMCWRCSKHSVEGIDY